MSADKYVRAAWMIIGAVTLLRFAFAASLPMTGDEAYYWEWSRRLALGYADHPPMVAYAAALFGGLSRSALALRVPFVFCGIGTTLAVADAARTLWNDEPRAALAALAATLAPMLVVLFVTINPEGPAAFAWAITLALALRAFRSHSRVLYAWMGVTTGIALLSHFLCWALAGGLLIASLTPPHRRVWRDGFGIAAVVALAVYAPFVAWNAAHGWQSFLFALVHRHPSEVQMARPFTTYLLCAAAFSPGFWIAATVAARRPAHALVAWTALPLGIGLLILAFHERVETYWFAGPYLSLCVALPAAVRSRATAWWVVTPACLLTALLFAAGIAPFQLYALAQRGGLHLRNSGPFEIFSYDRLAHRAVALARTRNAAIMTDGYGFSSLIDYYAGAAPVYIGYDAQGQEARRWAPDDAPLRTALFVDKAPLNTRPDFVRQLGRACGSVERGPAIVTRYRTYYTTWCGAMRPRAIAILRFEF